MVYLSIVVQPAADIQGSFASQMASIYKQISLDRPSRPSDDTRAQLQCAK